ncbi:MAG: hypothetical protein IT478_14870 [Xanthomonadales bacterium]|nr:hypothetical protein [Xanthomonadales bacterium]
MRQCLLRFAICLSLPASTGVQAAGWFGHARAGFDLSDAPTSWLDGGVGRHLADAEHNRMQIETQIAMLWEPDPAWRLYLQALTRGVAAGSGRHVGLVEAHLERDFFLADDRRIGLRVGQFFLPTSREAVDPLWQSRYTLTLSALNSWIAEEFRPIGIDAAWQSRDGETAEWELAATAFGGNDSAGALLAWRGFAQHDRLSVLGEVLQLPPLASLADAGEFGGQRDDGTRPFGRDLDGRIGYALRAHYGDPERLRGFASVVDTRGDRGLHRGEYAWRTRFAVLGGEWQSGERWTLAGEWLRGNSGMGFAPGPRVDIDFSAAYLLASFAANENWRCSARIEHFRISDRDGVAEDNGDRGRALTLSLFRQFGADWRGAIELAHGTGEHAAAPPSGPAFDSGGSQLRLEIRRSF